MPRVTPGGLCIYGGLCGWTLALAHGRGSDEAAIAAYLGRSDAFDDRSLHGTLTALSTPATLVQATAARVRGLLH